MTWTKKEILPDKKTDWLSGGRSKILPCTTLINCNIESVTTLKSLLCLHTNARSVFNKLQLPVSQYNPHIIHIAETWLDNNIKHSKIYLDNYNILQNDQPYSCGGGVLLYVHKSLNMLTLPETWNNQLQLNHCGT